MESVQRNETEQKSEFDMSLMKCFPQHGCNSFFTNAVKMLDFIPSLYV